MMYYINTSLPKLTFKLNEIQYYNEYKKFKHILEKYNNKFYTSSLSSLTSTNTNYLSYLYTIAYISI
jgi:hypothetical protein